MRRENNIFQNIYKKEKETRTSLKFQSYPLVQNAVSIPVKGKDVCYAKGLKDQGTSLNITVGFRNMY